MTTAALATGKLGKLPVRTDVRTLRLKRYVDAATLPTPPETVDLTPHVARHRLGAFASVPRYEHELVRAAAWLFGGLYIGLSLPLSARRQDVWDWTGSLSGDSKPGSWGGHAVDVVGFDAAGLTVVTWGR